MGLSCSRRRRSGAPAEEGGARVAPRHGTSSVVAPAGGVQAWPGARGADLWRELAGPRVSIAQHQQQSVLRGAPCRGRRVIGAGTKSTRRGADTGAPRCDHRPSSTRGSPDSAGEAIRSAGVNRAFPPTSVADPAGQKRPVASKAGRADDRLGQAGEPVVGVKAACSSNPFDRIPHPPEPRDQLDWAMACPQTSGVAARWRHRWRRRRLTKARPMRSSRCSMTSSVTTNTGQTPVGQRLSMRVSKAPGAPGVPVDVELAGGSGRQRRRCGS